jgi:hypothetical protein
MSIDVYGGVLKKRAEGPMMESVGNSINMSNRNFVIMMDALGIICDEACGHMDLDQFLGLARAWLRAHIDKPSAMVETRETVGDGGCTMIDLPLRAGYVNQAVHRVVTMLAQAKQQGATHVYWG